MKTENRQVDIQYGMIFMLGVPWGLPVFAIMRRHTMDGSRTQRIRYVDVA